MSPLPAGRVAECEAVVNRPAYRHTNHRPLRGRSFNHACWYRVGRAEGCDCYWHPILGRAIERDHSYLVQFTGPIAYFGNPDDYWWLAEDVAANPELVRAMSAELYAAFEEREDDVRFAEECAAEREGDVLAANASLVYVEEW
jgi:hypothetical protein